MVGVFNFPGRFFRDRRAGITTFSLVFIAASLMLGSFGLDVSGLMMARTKLQVTADATAHSALVYREQNTAADSITAALQMAALNWASNYLVYFA